MPNGLVSAQPTPLLPTAAALPVLPHLYCCPGRTLSPQACAQPHSVVLWPHAVLPPCTAAQQDDVIAGLRTTSKNMQRSQATLKSPLPTRTPPFSPHSPLHNSSSNNLFGDNHVAAAAAYLAAAAAAAGSPHTPITARRYNGGSSATVPAAAAAAAAAGGSRSDRDDDTAAAEDLLQRAREATGSSRGKKGARGADGLAAVAAAAAAAAAEDSGGSGDQGRGRDLTELLASVGRRAAGRGRASGKVSHTQHVKKKKHAACWHHLQEQAVRTQCKAYMRMV
jgi:hypothetical protein